MNSALPLNLNHRQVQMVQRLIPLPGRGGGGVRRRELSPRMTPSLWGKPAATGPAAQPKGQHPGSPCPLSHTQQGQDAGHG